MKRYFGWLIIALAVVLSSGAVYGQENPREARGLVPAEWGTLQSVTRGDSEYDNTRLFFEDSKGTVRMVILYHVPGRQWTIGDTIVINRSKGL
ncbi:MAG: hypothetical protein A2X96_06420 [Syntrophobacterales bacterium GWC2_56_13]|nr:MAG: hypothetical protein A2X96_06420 [Syntrophobacterales bacterium GWC2_56_13]OHE21132.1 MAG: hypothetical protein A2X95_06495 [Syntrophobacterales bacterium GWF2_56_9]